MPERCFRRFPRPFAEAIADRSLILTTLAAGGGLLLARDAN
jgi:hypothetical protein